MNPLLCRESKFIGTPSEPVGINFFANGQYFPHDFDGDEDMVMDGRASMAQVNWRKKE